MLLIQKQQLFLIINGINDMNENEYSLCVLIHPHDCCFFHLLWLTYAMFSLEYMVYLCTPTAI